MNDSRAAGPSRLVAAAPKFGHHPDPLIDTQVELDRKVAALHLAHSALERALGYRAVTPNGISIKNAIRSALDLIKPLMEVEPAPPADTAPTGCVLCDLGLRSNEFGNHIVCTLLSGEQYSAIPCALVHLAQAAHGKDGKPDHIRDTTKMVPADPEGTNNVD